MTVENRDDALAIRSSGIRIDSEVSDCQAHFVYHPEDDLYKLTLFDDGMSMTFTMATTLDAMRFCGAIENEIEENGR